MSWSRIEFYQNSSVCVYTSWESDVTKMATSVIPGFIVYMRTTDTYSRTEYHWENGRTGGETEAPPASPRKPGFRGRIRGAATYWPDRLPWAVATLHRGLPWAPGFSSRKREPGETSNLPQHCGWLYGSPSSDLTQWGSPGNLWAKSLGIWLWQRGGEGSATPSTWILANRVPAYRVQVIVPTSSFAHLQNQVRSHSDQDLYLGEVKICLTGILRWGASLALEPGLLTPRQGVEGALSPIWLKNAGDNSWKLCGSATFKLREGQADWLPEQTQYPASVHFKLIFVSGIRYGLSFFYIWISNYPSTIYWRGFFSPFEYSWLPSKILAFLIWLLCKYGTVLVSQGQIPFEYGEWPF